jgi:hypothetical protein
MVTDEVVIPGYLVVNEPDWYRGISKSFDNNFWISGGLYKCLGEYSPHVSTPPPQSRVLDFPYDTLLLFLGAKKAGWNHQYKHVIESFDRSFIEDRHETYHYYFIMNKNVVCLSSPRFEMRKQFVRVDKNCSTNVETTKATER